MLLLWLQTLILWRLHLVYGARGSSSCPGSVHCSTNLAVSKHISTDYMGRLSIAKVSAASSNATSPRPHSLLQYAIRSEESACPPLGNIDDRLITEDSSWGKQGSLPDLGDTWRHKAWNVARAQFLNLEITLLQTRLFIREDSIDREGEREEVISMMVSKDLRFRGFFLHTAYFGLEVGISNGKLRISFGALGRLIDYGIYIAGKENEIVNKLQQVPRKCARQLEVGSTNEQCPNFGVYCSKRCYTAVWDAEQFLPLGLGFLTILRGVDAVGVRRVIKLKDAMASMKQSFEAAKKAVAEAGVWLAATVETAALQTVYALGCIDPGAFILGMNETQIRDILQQQINDTYSDRIDRIEHPPVEVEMPFDPSMCSPQRIEFPVWVDSEEPPEPAFFEAREDSPGLLSRGMSKIPLYDALFGPGGKFGERPTYAPDD